MINFIFLKTFELCLKCIHDQQTLLFIKEIFVEIILYELSRLLERRYTLRSEKKRLDPTAIDMRLVFNHSRYRTLNNPR